jgi:hypothetical protein
MLCSSSTTSIVSGPVAKASLLRTVSAWDIAGSGNMTGADRLSLHCLLNRVIPQFKPR